METPGSWCSALLSFPNLMKQGLPEAQGPLGGLPGDTACRQRVGRGAAGPQAWYRPWHVGWEMAPGLLTGGTVRHEHIRVLSSGGGHFWRELGVPGGSGNSG